MEDKPPKLDKINDNTMKPAKSQRITIRFKNDEMDALKRLASRESTGCENLSEFIRLLVMREVKKSAGEGKPTGADYSTAFRTGRPWR